MRFDRPLRDLVKSCETACVADCCGIDAFEFSSSNVAAFLYRSDAKQPDGNEVAALRSQLGHLKARYGNHEASHFGAPIADLNAKLTARQVADLVDQISSAIDDSIQHGSR